jgi:serine kinase of HPr protein (carbohydrate metabolism regulator)
MIVHAGLVAFRIAGHWRGALVEGPSGIGKSDLALRGLELGGRLVADDRVLLWASAGILYGRAPDPLAGLLEVRGAGLAGVDPLPYCAVALVVACQAGPQGVERMPDEAFEDRLGIQVPLRRLWPLEPAAPLKLRRLMEQLGRAA